MMMGLRRRLKAAGWADKPRLIDPGGLVLAIIVIVHEPTRHIVARKALVQLVLHGNNVRGARGDEERVEGLVRRARERGGKRPRVDLSSASAPLLFPSAHSRDIRPRRG